MTSFVVVAPSEGLAQQAPVARFVTREYAFTVPATLPAGLVRVRVINRGTLPHYARIVRLDSAKTLADFTVWRKSGTRAPAWFVPVGGPAPIAPGDSAEAAVVLAPGRHLVFCTYPMPGGTSVHVDSGMVREITVRPSGSAASPNATIESLDSDATLIIGDYVFSPITLRAGHERVRVTNAGNTAHQALLVRLPDGVKEGDELAWFRANYRTRRPGRPTGGSLEVKPKETSWFSVWLEPGRYLLLCGFVAGNRRHFDMGMTRVIDVSRPPSSRPPARRTGSGGPSTR
jgi:uncharacterized cupredoxin-like copper-binding protein